MCSTSPTRKIQSLVGGRMPANMIDRYGCACQRCRCCLSWSGFGVSALLPFLAQADVINTAGLDQTCITSALTVIAYSTSGSRLILATDGVTCTLSEQSARSTSNALLRSRSRSRSRMQRKWPNHVLVMSSWMDTSLPGNAALLLSVRAFLPIVDPSADDEARQYTA